MGFFIFNVMQFYSKQYKIIFSSIALLCLLLILLLPAPSRNYIPVVWVIYGFVAHAISISVLQTELNKSLTRNYRVLLNAENITILEILGRVKINFFKISRIKNLEEKMDAATINKIKNYKSGFVFTIISFLLFGFFGILTVVLTW